MINRKAVLLLSGGIDSTTLLASLSADAVEIHALSFNYGQKHLAELEFAKLHASRYGVANHIIFNIDFDSMAHASSLTNTALQPQFYTGVALPPHPTDVYVPGRNLLMLSYAASFAEAMGIHDIYFAANADDGLRFPDCRPVFFESLNALFKNTSHTQQLIIHTPFIHHTKREIIFKSKELHINLNETLSCYTPINGKACGQCLSCRVREEAMV